MYVANWFDSKIEKPGASGDVGILINGECVPALYLEKGDRFLLKRGPKNGETLENRLLFFLGQEDVVATIPQDGFYLIKKDGFSEYLSKVNPDNIRWTPRISTKGVYIDNLKKLAEFDGHQAMTYREIIFAIKEYEKEEGKITKIKEALINETSSGKIKNGGVVYEINSLLTLRGLLDALEIRRLTKKMVEYKDIKELCLDYLVDRDGRDVEEERVFELQRSLFEFLKDNAASNYEAASISDAYFLNALIPSKSMQVKAMVSREAYKTGSVDKNVLLANVYQRYMRLMGIRGILSLYMDRGVPRDSLLDTIALKNLAISYAISYGQIIKIDENFEKEIC